MSETAKSARKRGMGGLPAAFVSLALAGSGCASSPAEGAVQAPAQDASAVVPGPPLGAACTNDAACGEGSGRVCLPSGRCGTATCTTASCGEGAECFLVAADRRSCLPTCGPSTPCAAGLVCAASGACVAPCTEGACGPDATCERASGLCVTEVSKRPSAAPIPACDDLPPRDCTAGTEACAALSSFEPKLGPGYEDYPLNGETASKQWRSYARADLQQIVKWSTALVACRARHWAFGNGAPLGLGDMSEANGAIPGTAIGEPGHPKGTHTNGLDMDIAYYQIDTKDNRLRPVCAHEERGSDAYHCVAEPSLLDTWRNALVLGAMVTSRRVRVIGMDGKVGPRVLTALPALCRDGYLDASACSRARAALAFEETDQGRGWFLFHHHHFHISMSPAPYAAAPSSFAPSEGTMLWSGAVPASSLERFEAIAGHARVE